MCDGLCNDVGINSDACGTLRELAHCGEMATIISRTVSGSFTSLISAAAFDFSQTGVANSPARQSTFQSLKCAARHATRPSVLQARTSTRNKALRRASPICPKSIHVNDSPVAPAKQRQERLRHGNRSDDVHFELGAQVLDGDKQRARDGNAGIVDECGEPGSTDRHLYCFDCRAD